MNDGVRIYGCEEVYKWIPEHKMNMRNDAKPKQMIGGK